MSGIIDFQARALERAGRPHFDVSVSTYQDASLFPGLLGRDFQDAVLQPFAQMPKERKDFKADEVIFDHNGIEHFRYVLLAITADIAEEKIGAFVPGEDPKKEASFLRPVFTYALQKGYYYWEVMREIKTREFPVPKDYFIFLPDPESKNPDRDDIIRALIPFKKAQREALLSGWDERTTAIRITHKKPTSLFLGA